MYDVFTFVTSCGSESLPGGHQDLQHHPKCSPVNVPPLYSIYIALIRHNH